VQVSKIIGLVLGLWVWLAPNLGALTFEYADGTKVTGDIVRPDPKFLQVRTEDNKYVDIEWGKLSQTTLGELKELALQKRDTKLLENVEPYIEISQDDIIKKTEVVVKPVPRLEQPPKGSLLGAMFKSPVGIVCLLLLYAANIYAGYEVASVRAYPPAMVCGIAAVAPIIGPVIFLCLPTKLPSRPDEREESLEAAAPEAAPGAASHSAAYGSAPAGHDTDAGEPGGAAPGHAAPAAVPATQVFKRGQFTFNRRFIETKFSAFFGAVRRGADKDLVLLVKSGRGEYVATRISRIAANDMHLDVHKGGASHEVQIPFGEIQEIQIKHESV
jgi:hypothetical protein